MASETFLSRANTKFALALYKKFNEEDNTGNIFYSPFSISAALAMVRLGAAGNTARQMSEVLCFSEAEAHLSEGDVPMTEEQQTQTIQPLDGGENVDALFEELLRELNEGSASYALSIANRLYGEQTFEFVQQFLDTTQRYYDAQLEKVDFISSAEPSRIKINTWVEEKTQGKIANLLPPDSVNSMTMLALVNAIYFKGKWEHPFEEMDTVDADFHLNKNDTKKVKMMSVRSTFNFRKIEELNCKVLELPYVGEALSMILILPNAIEDESTGLEKLEKELTSDKYEEYTREGMERENVNVKLPRFELTQSYDMRRVLESMGMVDAFDTSKSDFSGMSEGNRLSISAVFHKAFVAVNEEGTEAAAATGVVMSLTSARDEVTEEFEADHPFLIFIRHKRHRTVLFAGRVSSP